VGPELRRGAVGIVDAGRGREEVQVVLGEVLEVPGPDVDDES
jgi:hypothetical protein